MLLLRRGRCRIKTDDVGLNWEYLLFVQLCIHITLNDTIMSESRRDVAPHSTQ